MKKKVVSLLLAATTCFSLVACGGGSGDADTEKASESKKEETIVMPDGYDETSSEIYTAALGEFYDAYQTAKAEEDLDTRYALEAVAEAKLLESGVTIPTETQYGNFGLRRTAPRTAPYVLWGDDYERYHNVVVANELITAADQKEMKEKWGELKGTGTYEQWAKDYLTGKGYTLKDSYTYLYTTDPVTWDDLNTSLAADHEAILNTYDNLLEYDCEGTIQPALAESLPEVSEDGLTYTFHLRQGVNWVDQQGREVAEVTADDFVAGLQHLLDAQAGLESLVYGIIENAQEYGNGDISDFSQVGVKAVDDYTVEYTLAAPCPYFTTMFGYALFAPLCRSYYVSQGGKFGSEYDPSAADYNYGKSPDTIVYCGPYVVSSFTEKNSIVFKLNESYWNAANVNNKTITWIFDDNTDPTKRYNQVMDGTIDSASLATEAVELAQSATDDNGNNVFDTYAIVSDTNATTYTAFYNLNRNAFYNFNDHTTAVSEQTDDQKAVTKAAMNNQNFRLALSFALDRGSYHAQTVGEQLKYNAVRNSYTPGNFVALSKDVTVQINGTDTTFAKGTYYGAILQAQLNADGFEGVITVWDPNGDDGNGSSDGFDGWYNVDNAKAYMDKAIEELKADGVEITAENPVVLDLPMPSGTPTYANKANVYKQSLESAFGGLVQVNLVDCIDTTTWLYTGYYTSYGYENNYDIFDLSGWGPDYGDPATYLDTFLPDYEGYVTKSLGIY